MIGNEGMFDITHFLGAAGMHYLVVAETTGHAFLLDENILKHEFDCDATVQHTLLLYAQALLTQMAQTIVCNKDHSLSQQLCLLLLLVNDKSLSDDLLITQESIAHMMGVRRGGVTEAAGKLRDLGLIDYKRGHITVIDRPGLEKQCCECYAVVTDELKRLFNY
jgi:CRP-like cAMP-binding protein